MTPQQKARMLLIGRQGFIKEEMERLGFWPPNPEVAEQAREAEAQLKVLYEELARLQTDLNTVETEIRQAGDIQKLLGEIRRQRIERVRAARAKRKEERAEEKARKKAAEVEWRKQTLPYLGRDVSAGLTFEGGEDDKLESLGLPVVHTAGDIARAVGITTGELAWLAYHRTATGADHYSRFTIPKKKGGVRVISSPKPKLRAAQGWLLLSVLEKLPVHDAAMAFRPGRSVVDNAARHAGRAVIVKVDLKDFFPSIGWRRVKGLFQSFGYNEGVATILALVATETPRVPVLLDGERRFAAIGGRCLPQGACTSPAVTNLLCRGLDSRLTGAAQAWGFTYTRYADDMVFSHDSPDAPVGALLTLVRRIVGEEKLTVNEEKTQVLRPQDRQVVTGLVVNAGHAPRVSRDDLRRFRAFLHGCETKGMEAMTEHIGKDALAYASGYLSFLHMARPDVAQKIQAANPWLTRWRQAAEPPR